MAFSAKQKHKIALGRRIVAVRLKLEITQMELARRLKISRATLCHWERGRYLPSFYLVAKIAKALNVSPAWIAFGND